MYFWKYILAKKAGLSQKKCNMALYGLPVLPIAEAFEKTVTGNPISVTDALAQDALSLQVAFTPTQDGTPSIDSEPTTEPYLSKLIPRGNKEYYSLVGATVAWNQLVQNGDFASTSGWTPYTGTINVADNECTYTFSSLGSDVYTNTIRRSDISRVKDHVYLTRYYFYTDKNDVLVNTLYFGSVAKTKTVNNGWSEVCGIGKNTSYTTSTASIYFGVAYASTHGFEVGDTYKIKNAILVDLTQRFGTAIADYVNTLETANTGAGIAWLKSYGFFSKIYYPYNPGELISVNTSGHKIGSTTYPIDNIDLRGLFKLSNGKLYCEGDIYPPSGDVERKFEYRAYQSGDESLTDAITDGTHTVVKLTTPTTESATPYTSPATVEAGGTEEFIDNRTVPIPVGNETYYAAEYAVEGRAGVTVNHSATSTDTPTEYEVEFTQQGTVYGGTVDIVTGELTVTWGYIASYNGETLPGEWMSSKDVYASGTTPSTGAEVAYELATPQTYNLTPEQVTMLLGDNYLSTEDGTITLTYMAGK